jgi:hypothetical protein
VLQAVVTCGDGKAAVAAAVAGALAKATDEATRQRLREWLAAPPMEMEAVAISVLERQAREAAALRARVAELEAIPVNTRAAIVELAQQAAVGGGGGSRGGAAAGAAAAEGGAAAAAGAAALAAAAQTEAAPAPQVTVCAHPCPKHTPT